MQVHSMIGVLGKRNVYSLLGSGCVWFIVRRLYSNEFILVFLLLSEVVALCLLLASWFLFPAALLPSRQTVCLGFLFLNFPLKNLSGFFEISHPQNFGIFLCRFLFLSLLALKPFLYFFSFVFVNFRLKLYLYIGQKIDLFQSVLICKPFLFLEFYLGFGRLLFQKFYQFFWFIWWNVMKSRQFITTIVFAALLRFFLQIFLLVLFYFFDIIFLVKISDLF